MSRETMTLELMDAVTVGLGAFGIVTRLTLAVQPTFAVSQRGMSTFRCRRPSTGLDEIMADGYSVSLFTSWGPNEIEQLWRKQRVADDHDDDHDATSPRYGAMPAL